MYSLYIDTHDNKIIIGLFKDGVLLEESVKESSRNHSDFTMPMIKTILENHKLTARNLNEILVVNGPGSFTGVRIGVTIAKTLAYTLNIPIKTITSLEMYAVSSKLSKDKIVAINDVKGVFYGIYDKDNKPIEDLQYKSNDDFLTFKEANSIELLTENKIDLQAIYNHLKNKPIQIAHKVNPIYIKVIEALKND